VRGICVQGGKMAAQYDAAAKDRNMEFESVSLLLHLCFCTVLVPIWMCACMQSFALAVYHIKCTVTACPPGFPQTLVTALYGNPSYLHYTFTHCGNWLPYGCCHDMLHCCLMAVAMTCYLVFYKYGFRALHIHTLCQVDVAMTFYLVVYKYGFCAGMGEGQVSCQERSRRQPGCHQLIKQ